MNDLLETAIDAAKTAGKIIEENYAKERSSSFKDDTAVHIVTATDLAAEKAILAKIQAAYPTHAYFSEEAGSSPNVSDYIWSIDPLDGTTNFVQGIAHFCVSIGLSYQDQRLLGVVYDPINNHLFTAEKNQGATLNNTPLRGGQKNNLARCVISINRASNVVEIKRCSSALGTIMLKTRTPRILGSTALAVSYAAAGKLDAVIGYGINYYDAAAAALIAEEAGLVVSTFDNQPWQPAVDRSADLLITNQALHKDFLTLIKQAS